MDSCRISLTPCVCPYLPGSKKQAARKRRVKTCYIGSRMDRVSPDAMRVRELTGPCAWRARPQARGSIQPVRPQRHLTSGGSFRHSKGAGRDRLRDCVQPSDVLCPRSGGAIIGCGSDASLGWTSLSSHVVADEVPMGPSKGRRESAQTRRLVRGSCDRLRRPACRHDLRSRSLPWGVQIPDDRSFVKPSPYRCVAHGRRRQFSNYQRPRGECT